MGQFWSWNREPEEIGISDPSSKGKETVPVFEDPRSPAGGRTPIAAFRKMVNVFDPRSPAPRTPLESFVRLPSNLAETKTITTTNYQETFEIGDLVLQDDTSLDIITCSAHNGDKPRNDIYGSPISFAKAKQSVKRNLEERRGSSPLQEINGSARVNKNRASFSSLLQKQSITPTHSPLHQSLLGIQHKENIQQQ